MLYFRGRARRSASAPKNCLCTSNRTIRNVETQTDCTIDVFELEELLDKSLKLWSEADKKLDLLHEQKHDLFKEDSSLEAMINPLESSDELSSLHINSTRPCYSSSTHNASIQVDTIAGDLRHLKQKELILEKRLMEIERLYSDSQNRVSRLEAVLRDRLAPKHISRRYHFVDNGSLLTSSLSKRPLSQCSKASQFFFEVRLPVLRQNVHDPLAGHERFSYTETNEYEDSFSRKSPQESENLEKVLLWLSTVQPRTYVDAEPLLVLARDVLHKIASETLKKSMSEKYDIQKEFKLAKESFDQIIAAKDAELQNVVRMFESRIQLLEEVHLKQQQDLRQLTQDTITYQITFPMTLLRFRNVVLERRNKALKQKIFDLQSRSLLETLFELNREDQHLVLQKLLEIEGVVSSVSAEFFQRSAMSDSSKTILCQQILCALEMKHAGRISWLHIVSEVLMTTPSNVGRKVLGWYCKDGINTNDKESDKVKSAILDQIQLLNNKGDFLVELRDDIASGKRDLWDVVATILQTPKAQAFAAAIGFGPEDVDVVLQIWPEFLIWLQAKQTSALEMPNPALNEAVKRLKASNVWEELKRQTAIMRNSCFDLEVIPLTNRFSLEDTYRLVVEIQCQKQHDDIRDELSMPLFVRKFALLRTNLYSSATRFLLRLQNSVKSYYKGNARIRTFGRVAGMLHPLRFMDCCTRFLRKFWLKIMEFENVSTLPLSDAKSNSHFCSNAAERLTNWLQEDSAIECRSAVISISATLRTFLFEFPNYKIHPSESELLIAFLPAIVNVPSGTRLPLKDMEKFAMEKDSEQVASLSNPSLSLDLVSEIVLDLFLKLVKKWEEFFTKLWIEEQENWDWGAKENSPDLNSLRLFLAMRCNLNMQRSELAAFYAEIATTEDDIDPESVASTCFKYLQESIRKMTLPDFPCAEENSAGLVNATKFNTSPDMGQNQSLLYIQEARLSKF